LVETRNITPDCRLELFVQIACYGLRALSGPVTLIGSLKEAFPWFGPPTLIVADALPPTLSESQGEPHGARCRPFANDNVDFDVTIVILDEDNPPVPTSIKREIRIVLQNLPDTLRLTGDSHDLFLVV